MVRKITLLLMTLLAITTNATEIWKGSCTIGNWSGSNVTVDKSAFESAATGNIIKVTFASYTEKDNSNADVTYWQYSLGQKDNGWEGLTGFSGGDLTKGQKSASYFLTATNVTELQTHGLVVNGRYVTVTKVELLSVSSTESIFSGSQATGDWSVDVDLTYDKKEKLSEAMMNDYIRMTYTVTASGAQAAIQNASWENIIGRDDNSYVADGDNTGKTLVVTIDDAVTLEGIQINGIRGRGKNITITGIELLKTSTRYDAVPLSIGTDGIATFSSSKHLDFTGTGVKPYYASSVSVGIVQLTSVEKTKKWAGYVVRGAAGNYEVPVIDGDEDWLDAFNHLRATNEYSADVYRSAYSGYDGDGDEATKIKIKTYYRYIFAKDGSDIGFYRIAPEYSRLEDATTYYYHKLAPHKAYLETPTDIAPAADSRVALLFDDEITSLSGVMEHTSSGNGTVYSLNGMAVKQPKKGLYIRNGKKYFVK